MPVIKVRCPECGVRLRQDVEAVNRPTDVTITCPACECEFVAEAKPDLQPSRPESPAARPAAKTSAKPSARPARRRDDDDDDDDRPRRKKKAAGAPNQGLIIGGIVGSVLLLGVIVVLLVLLSGPEDKKDTAKKDNAGPTAPVVQPAVPAARPNPGAGTPARPPVTPSPSRPNPGSTAKPRDRDDDDALLPKVPDPPVIRMDKSFAVEISTPVERPPKAPPLAPDEDPFIRAKGFRVEGALPPLPKLPPANQRPLLSLDAGGHSAFVKNVFITPRGDRVITVGEDKSVRVWDSHTGQPVHTIRLPAGPGEEGELKAAALSENGEILAVSGIPLKGVKKGAVPIFILNVEHGTLVKSIPAARDDVLCLDFSPDGKKLAAGCTDGTVQLFDVATGRSAGMVTAHAAPVREVRFHPASKKPILGTLGVDSTVRIWDITAKRNSTLQISGLGPTTIAWAHDGSMLGVGGLTGEIMLFGGNGQLIRTIPKRAYKGETVQVLRMKFLPSDQEIAYCGVGGSGWAGIVSVATGAERIAFTGHDNTVMAIHVSEDGTRVATSGGNNHETLVWSTADGKTLARLTGTGKSFWGVGWAKDGKSIAWGTDNKPDGKEDMPLAGTFRLDDLGRGDFPNPTNFTQSVRNDPLVKIEREDEHELTITPKGKRPFSFTMPRKQRIYAASALPGRGGKVIVGGTTSLILIDSQNGGGVQRTFVGHAGHITSIAPSPDGLYFVTGSSDQTIRIWQPELEEPVLSIFLAGSDWIAWTPQGYYACSPNGEQLVAWQVNASVSPANKLPVVHPASRFRPSMYQPAVIKYLIPGGNVQFALAMAQKFDKALVEATSVADVLPPEVELVTPTGETNRIDGDTVSVKATAKGTAKQPVTAMRLLVDGRPFQGSSGVRRFEKPLETAEATWEVPVLPGPHSFAVIAESAVSKGMSHMAVVTRSGTPPKPNLYVLTIGVSAYPGDMKLRYAASDAKLLANTLQNKSQGVFGDIQIRVVTDAAATKRGIQEGLDWLKSKMTAKDIGIVAFSGHGTRDPYGKFYLVPVDVSKRDLAGSCLAGDEFKARMENIPGRLVAILDACHSGQVAETTPPPSRADGLVRDLVAEDSGVVVMCASLGSEYAIESRATKSGFFTLGLVEGLSGHADIDQDGVIFIHELEIYASARVQQLSGGKQNPTTGRPPSIHPFPIALSNPKNKT